MRPGILIGLVLCTLALTTAALARVAGGAGQVRHFTLYVRDGWLTMPDGAQVYVWGFTDNPDGPASVPGPSIVVDEGDTVEVLLVNDRDPTANNLMPVGEGHTIHLHGLDTSTEHDGVPETHPAGLARQGGSYIYRFVARHAGTYFYHCHQNNVEHQQMGMYGPLVVRAAGGRKTAYTGGPAYDREHTLVLAEIGAEGHDHARRAVQEGAEPYNWLRYRPDYMLANNRAFRAEDDLHIPLQAAPRERVLVRAINAGYVVHALRLASGQPFRIVASDGRPWTGGPTTDVIWIGPGEKYDLLVQAVPAGGLAIRDRVGADYRGPMVGAPAMIDDRRAPAIQTPRTGGAPRSFTLYIRDGSLHMPDSASIYVYGFTDDPMGPAKVPGPGLVVDEGDVVEITLVNDQGPTSSGHALAFLGLEATLQGPDLVRPGESGTYRFVATRAGSYAYVDLRGQHQQMGMYGSLVVRPRGDPRRHSAGGQLFDHDYTMVISEMDAPAHEETRRALAEGVSSPIERPYTANYFLINGLAYPDTEADAGTMVRAAPGERVLLRTINAGKMPHSMHLHGYHFQLAQVNGRPWPAGPLKDTVLIAPGESYDLLFVADQPGLFPFHDHFETANTNNGAWLGGMHTMVATGMQQHHAGAPAAMPAPAAGATPPAAGQTIYLRDNFFSPNFTMVPAGTTVRWEHQGKVEHTVTSLYGIFDSGSLEGGDVFSYTFSAPGRYDYYCRFHITNRGTIVVQ